VLRSRNLVDTCKKFKYSIFIFVFFLLGDSSASEVYMPTFRNTLSVPSL
jgi:hypothetical protein